MKSVFSLLLVGICLFCTKEQSAPTTSNNYFSVDGKSHLVTDAALLDVATPNVTASSPYLHTLVFGTANVMMSGDAENYFRLSGSGPVLGLVCYTQSPDLEEGTYFVALRMPNKAQEIGLGFYTADWGTAQTGGNYWQASGTPLLAGKMNVMKKNNKWKLDAALVGEDNSSIRLNYEGNFKAFLFRFIPDERGEQIQ
jgi:hypothetical protein